MKYKMETVVDDIEKYTNNFELQWMVKTMFNTLNYCKTHIENMEETNKSKDKTLRNIERELKIIDSYVFTDNDKGVVGVLNHS